MTRPVNIPFPFFSFPIYPVSVQFLYIYVSFYHVALQFQFIHVVLVVILLPYTLPLLAHLLFGPFLLLSTSMSLFRSLNHRPAISLVPYQCKKNSMLCNHFKTPNYHYRSTSSNPTVYSNPHGLTQPHRPWIKHITTDRTMSFQIVSSENFFAKAVGLLENLLITNTGQETLGQ